MIRSARTVGVLVVLASALAGGTPLLGGGAAGAGGYGQITVSPAAQPAFAMDAPDPDVVLDGSTYYAFTTGTDLGNSLQALVDTSGSPATGWGPYTTTGYGSTALPSPPSWETPGTQTSPGVFSWDGQWLMYYDAATDGRPGDSGADCLSVASAATLTPSDPVFTDTSTGPLLCKPALGGAIDPSPFVDQATGLAYLTWKSNDGGSSQPAKLWSQQLSPDGLSLVGAPHLLLTQDTAQFPWETTIEDPDMVQVGATYFLTFSAGTWDSANYGEAVATCDGPVGPCTQTETQPFLGSYTGAAGPGGGSFFQDANGNWYLAYAAWPPGCTSYTGDGCVGARQLFVAPATFSPASLAAPVVGMAATPNGNGYWLADASGAVTVHGAARFFGSMAGQPLDAPITHIVATPDGGGYWLVAADGGTFAFGDAGFYGSMGGRRLDAPVVSLAPTPDGRGYWLVAADGGIFAFGDAGFHGSMGGHHLNRPVVGMAADAATGGYWLVASDGGIFAFGAPFYGSTGNLTLAEPVNGMSAGAGDAGYRFVASDGGIFAFGGAAFRGSMGGHPLNAPIMGMATDTATGGYWLVAADGGIFAFDASFYGAD